ncbi:hypothetical protein [Cryptosporangium phraense]|uniref:Uncharacterized protein n=1 Tax=Cryptosporangium phraense TaxID=2593070 RepID=A0A545ATX4_9ACTN|nr:hypothetical protein [Cryptosporangium phraense]TQS44776.1 hypothetical protein FL583_12495 [Cryptosporangium phraense]
MEQTSAAVRDLTDSEQNEAVLTLASRLLTDGTATDGNGPAVAAEAAAAARSRARLAAAATPVHLTVVFAMYGETGRMVPRSEHPHGEDFVRAKVRQLDWLTAGLPGVTWNILACDDGCPDEPSSADVMAGIIAAEGYDDVAVIRLADLIGGKFPISPAFDALTSTNQSRKGGSILAALATAVRDGAPEGVRHVVLYTDADLSSNLAQVGSLAAPILDGAAGALGQRYGMDGAVLVKPDGPSVEPHSTGDKPDKLIVLFRHFVRATLIPDLARVLDTQAGFKAFDAEALAPVLGEMSSFNETFDVELLIHLAQRYGAGALAVEPIVFTEDFAATNFPSVDPGARHLAMVQQVVDLYDSYVAAVAPATGEAAEVLGFVRGLDLDAYVRLIEALRAEDAGDPTLFDRRWTVANLRSLVG